ncbi:hypothetical protein MUN78_15945 [Leucobacter allii]|uniref:Uncharacterized protein n=1 Tax=Leucobacter allii TaxID=2932247 RepID=A0ABY4FLI8_9MICO|nr:hypothetical protein [Leucobacter allii]UOQ57124.1 hypothetical protein MUN78_15945 [Leucobacter allii]
MNEDRGRTIARIVVFAMLVVGAGAALWLFTQEGTDLGDQGIFQFFSDPTAPSG